MQLAYEEIIKKICKDKNLEESKVEELIKEKLEQLSYLISKEGAAYIVANELGVKLIDKTLKRFKINQLSSVLRNVEVLGKVIKIYEVKNFKTPKREGRIVSFLFGDETGTTRVVVWDEKLINKIENGLFKEGDTLLIKSGYVKENNGVKEIHLGSLAEIEVNPEGEKIENVSSKLEIQKKKIKDLKENDFAKIEGTIVQVFRPSFFEACPECGKRLELVGDKFSCKEHGFVNEVLIPVLTFFLDDGTENIRVVCFRENAEKLIGLQREELEKIRQDYEIFEPIREKLLGMQVGVVGKVTKNNMFEERLEFMARDVFELNPGEVLKRIEN